MHCWNCSHTFSPFFVFRYLVCTLCSAILWCSAYTVTREVHGHHVDRSIGHSLRACCPSTTYHRSADLSLLVPTSQSVFTFLCFGFFLWIFSFVLLFVSFSDSFVHLFFCFSAISLFGINKNREQHIQEVWQPQQIINTRDKKPVVIMSGWMDGLEFRKQNHIFMNIVCKSKAQVHQFCVINLFCFSHLGHHNLL